MQTQNIADRMSVLHMEYAKEMNGLVDGLVLRGEDGILLYLYTEGDAFASDLKAHFGLTAGRVANILKTLEEKGMVQRSQDTTDSRRFHISLTKKGRGIAQEQFGKMTECHQKIVDTVGPDQMEVFLGELRRVLDAFRATGMVAQN